VWNERGEVRVNSRARPALESVARLAWLMILSLALRPQEAPAGPPFLTDDPEPVEYQHWEFYLASQDMLEVPTGSAKDNLGNGHLSLLRCVKYHDLKAQRIACLQRLMLPNQKIAPGVHALAGFGRDLEYRRIRGDTPKVGDRCISVVIACLGEV